MINLRNNVSIWSYTEFMFTYMSNVFHLEATLASDHVHMQSYELFFSFLKAKKYFEWREITYSCIKLYTCKYTLPGYLGSMTL